MVQGLPKYHVKINSLSVDTLKLIAEALDKDEYDSTYKKARKFQVLSYLINNEYDTVSFGCIYYEENGVKEAFVIPTSKPYLFDANNEDHKNRYTFKELVEDLVNTEVEDIDNEFFTMTKEQFDNGDFGTETPIAIAMIKKVIGKPRSYPAWSGINKLCIKLNNVTQPKRAPTVKFESDTVKPENQGNRREKFSRRLFAHSTPGRDTTRHFIENSRIHNLTGVEDLDDVDMEETLKRSILDQGAPSRFHNSLVDNEGFEQIPTKDQVKIKVTLKVIGFDDLKNLKTWIKDSNFALELAGVTDERIKASQLVSHLRDGLKHQVIRKLARSNDLPNVDKVYKALEECVGNTSLEAKKSLEKFQINLHRPIIEQFHTLESIVERAWPHKSQEATHELAEIKMIDKLPKSVVEESLFKFRDDDLDTDELLDLLQKILDSVREVKSINFIDDRKIICHFCNKPGHKRFECRSLKSQNWKDKGKHGFSKPNIGGFNNMKSNNSKTFQRPYQKFDSGNRNQGVLSGQNKQFNPNNYSNNRFNYQSKFTQNKGSQDYSGQKPNSQSKPNYNSNSRYPKYTGSCTYCKKQGHRREDCYALKKNMQVNFLEHMTNQEQQFEQANQSEFRGDYKD